MRFHFGCSFRPNFNLKWLLFLGIGVCAFLGSILDVNALIYNGNLIQVNSTFDDNGNFIESNGLPVFSYDNFYFSDNKYYRTDTFLLGYTNADLSTSYVMTHNINYYMEKPCNPSDNLSYTQRIRFYYRSGAKLDLSQVNVTLGNYGCNGYWEQNGDNWDYVMTCNLQPNNYVVGSLTFGFYGPFYNNISDYRIAIQRNFDYQCSINSGNVIENNNINTQNIINNQNNNTQEIITNNNNNTETIVNAQEDTTDAINNLDDSITDDDVNGALDTGNDFFDNFEIDDSRGFSAIVTAPIQFLRDLLTSQSSCNPLNIGFNPSDGVHSGSASWSIPCGDILWSKAPSSIILLWETLIWGLLGYRVLVDLFKFVQRMLDPEDKSEFVMRL